MQRVRGGRSGRRRAHRLRNRQRLVGAVEELDRHEHQFLVADVLEVVHLEFARPVGSRAGSRRAGRCIPRSSRPSGAGARGRPRSPSRNSRGHGGESRTAGRARGGWSRRARDRFPTPARRRRIRWDFAPRARIPAAAPSATRSGPCGRRPCPTSSLRMPWHFLLECVGSNIVGPEP